MALIVCEECGKDISEQSVTCVHCGHPNKHAAKKTKFCRHCGETIDYDAVVCVKCGKQVEELKQARAENPNIIINNSNVNKNVNRNYGGRVRRRRSLIFDLFMICITGGLWIIWMIFRPKYY